MSQTIAAPIPAAVDHERTLVLAIEVSKKLGDCGASAWPAAYESEAHDRPRSRGIAGAYRARAAARGRSIERVIAVYEAGWSGFWLARWLMRHGVEVYVVQPSSVPVDRRIRRNSCASARCCPSIIRTALAAGRYSALSAKWRRAAL